MKWELTKENMKKFENDGLNASQIKRLTRSQFEDVCTLRDLMKLDLEKNMMSASNIDDMIYLKLKGYSYIDIGRILNTPSSTVEYRLKKKNKKRGGSFGKELPSNCLPVESRELLRGNWL